VDEKVGMILDNSMNSDRQNNENQSHLMANSIFQNKISNILCN
jgi:hypothetical protein